jgi:serine/threonine-protein kinase
MGIVYLARDSRLGRDVAIKIADEQFGERFEREARAVAALNHSNICTLHDVGPDYLVMEFVDGETLAEVLAQRPRSAPALPLDEALRLARQIAAALEAAHEKGIVHRDLKPGNIKVKADGTVKVLDFGLAKIKGDGAGASKDDLTNSPTVAIGATQQGVILGTAAYMAPEQARGKPVDKRADIWAFGTVLYEMVAGRKAFNGEDASTILAAVIQGEPQWDLVPTQLRRLLKRCLEKDPRRRLRDIGDVWDLLDEAPQPISGTSPRGRAGWIAAGVLALVATLALWAPWRAAPRPSDKPLARLEVDLGDEVSLVPLEVPTAASLAISPDGTRLVYVASVSGSPRKLLIRKLDQPRAVELAGTQGASVPFFSPDGRWVGFFDGKRVNRISVDGGAAVPLTELGIFTGASWSEDGSLIVGSGLTKGLERVPADGGAVSTVLELGNQEQFHAMPQLLPGGNAVLVTIYGTPPTAKRASIEVASLNNHSRKTIIRGATSARYLPSGHLVYTTGSTMFAVPFDVETLETRGTAVPVLDDMASDSAGIGQFDVSRDGTLVYRKASGSGRPTVSFRWLDVTGAQEPLQTRPGVYLYPRLSPDGKRIAMVISEGGSQDVWVYDMQRDTMTRLTFGGAAYVNPLWSPDGRFVVVGSIGNGLFSVRADGASRPQPLMQGNKIQFPTSFTPDGTRLAFFEIEGTPQVWTVPIENDRATLKAGTPTRYLSTQFVDLNATFSPDGRWLAYESNDAGRREVYVRAFPAPASGQGSRWQVSNNGGTSPVWSQDGRNILYRAGDEIRSVEYKVTGDSFVADRSRVWGKVGGATAFDLAPDGKRLIVTTPTGTQDAPKLEHTVVFLQNFFDELRRRVPTGR